MKKILEFKKGDIIILHKEYFAQIAGEGITFINNGNETYDYILIGYKFINNEYEVIINNFTDVRLATKHEIRTSSIE